MGVRVHRAADAILNSGQVVFSDGGWSCGNLKLNWEDICIYKTW